MIDWKAKFKKHSKRRIMPDNHPFKVKFGKEASAPADITTYNAVLRDVIYYNNDRKKRKKTSHHLPGKEK